MGDHGVGRGRAVWLLCALFAMGLSSGCSSSAGPDATAMTETFNGVLSAGGVATHAFNVTQAGTLDATVTSISPQSSITVGFGVGQVATTGCALISFTESGHVGTDLSGTINPGSYCVTIYDVGNVQGSVNYTLTVVHP
jgi:hypothetical protein